MTSPLCTPLKRNFTMASLALIPWMKLSNLLISLRYTINGQCAQEDSLLEICFCGSFASLFSTIQLPDLENGTPICFLPHVALMASACFCVLSKAYKRVFVAKATQIQLGNADPTDGCTGESVHSTDEVEAMLEFQPI